MSITTDIPHETHEAFKRIQQIIIQLSLSLSKASPLSQLDTEKRLNQCIRMQLKRNRLSVASLACFAYLYHKQALFNLFLFGDVFITWNAYLLILRIDSFMISKIKLEMETVEVELMIVSLRNIFKRPNYPPFVESLLNFHN